MAVQIGNHEDWPAIFIACLRKQLVVLPLDQSIGAQQRDAALEICRATAVISASSAKASAKENVPTNNSPQIIPLRTPDIAADWGENRPSLLKLTSGTTAAPRAIRFRSHQLLADCYQICETMDISENDLNFGVIPVTHSYGFSNLLTPLIARGVPMVMSRDGTPRAVIADLARTGATVFPGTPAFYQAFGEIGDVPNCQNSGCAFPLVRRSPAPSQKSFSRNSSSPSILSMAHRNAVEFATIARAQPLRTVLLASRWRESKSICSIQWSPPRGFASVARQSSDGYFPEPDNQKLGNGVFLPDDLLQRQNSALKIVGRISDVINVAGKKVNPAEVEALLVRFKGVRQAVVFGRSTGAGLRNEEVAACVLASPDVSENDLLRFCRNSLSGWQVPKRIFIVDMIPTNERGKISRRELARQFSGRDETSPLRTLAS